MIDIAKDNDEFVVYKHTLKQDGRVYIGQTCRLKNRWKASGSQYRNCIHFYRAIKKYGWDAFDHEIILEGLNRYEADIYEGILIEQYKATDPKYGFNLRSGGLRGGPLAESTRKKISEAVSQQQLGVPLSEKHKQAISESQKNSAKARAHVKKIQEMRRKKIVCIETGDFFNSVQLAANWVGIHQCGISDCLHGRQKTAGGYHWRLATEEEINLRKEHKG